MLSFDIKITFGISSHGSLIRESHSDPLVLSRVNKSLRKLRVSVSRFLWRVLLVFCVSRTLGLLLRKGLGDKCVLPPKPRLSEGGFWRLLGEL